LGRTVYLSLSGTGRRRRRRRRRRRGRRGRLGRATGRGRRERLSEILAFKKSVKGLLEEGEALLEGKDGVGVVEIRVVVVIVVVILEINVRILGKMIFHLRGKRVRVKVAGLH
jgi:hypothetical protein